MYDEHASLCKKVEVKLTGKVEKKYPKISGIYSIRNGAINQRPAWELKNKARIQILRGQD